MTRPLFIALAALWAFWPGAPRADSATAPESSASLDRYQEMLARTLFSPNRRAAAGETTPEEAADLPVLQGVVLARDKRIALVAFGNPSTVRRVKEGQDIGQWQIEKIIADRIALRSPEGKTTVVRLKSAGADKSGQSVNSETSEPAARSGEKKY